jgi:hypothetical protein
MDKDWLRSVSVLSLEEPPRGMFAQVDEEMKRRKRGECEKRLWPRFCEKIMRRLL